MTAGHLFCGIGGFPLSCEWAGIENVWSNEIDPFCCKVLRKNFKHEIIEADIRTIGKHNLKPVDIITGGFPCQPYSTAGKRKGKEDSRHLWPEMLRIIGEVQPSIVVGENVYGLLNWSGGLVFNEVQTDLENLGYSVTPFVLPACGIEAPHRRNRVWFIAYADRDGNEKELAFRKNPTDQRSNKKTPERDIREGKNRKRIWYNINGGHTETLPHSNHKRLQGGKVNGSVGKVRAKQGQLIAGLLQSAWQDFPTQSPICGGNDGIPNRVDRIKSLGNAIVPQVAFEIFKAIMKV